MRTIDQILKEVSSRSDPQRQLIMKQVADIPRQVEAETAGLDAKLTQANEDILGSARDRGVGFGGIPIGEQAKYAATDYAPALARVKTAGQQRATTLEAALADMGSRDFATAQDIFNQDRTFAEQQRQFNEQLALQQENARRAAAADAAPAWMQALGMGGGTQGVSTQGSVDDNEEARFEQFRQQELASQRALSRRVGATPGLSLQGGGNGLSVRGGGTIPSSVNTGRIPIR